MQLVISRLSITYRTTLTIAIQMVSLSRFTPPHLRDYDNLTIAIISPSESR